jgi:hypothetical protein
MLHENYEGKGTGATTSSLVVILKGIGAKTNLTDDKPPIVK